MQKDCIFHLRIQKEENIIEMLCKKELQKKVCFTLSFRHHMYFTRTNHSTEINSPSTLLVQTSDY